MEARPDRESPISSLNDLQSQAGMRRRSRGPVLYIPGLPLQPEADPSCGGSAGVTP